MRRKWRIGRLTVAFAVLVTAVAAFLLCPLVQPSLTGQEARTEDLGHGYSRNGEYVYFAGKRIDQEGRRDLDAFAKAVGHPLTLCKDVHAPSFTALSTEYSKDKSQVYYKWISPGRFWVVRLPDADPATFAVLDFNLAKDAKRVWKGDRVIDGADPATAQVVRPHWVWKDRRRVYYQHAVIEGADPATFRHVGQGFYRDAKRVWWCTTALREADPESFQTYGDESPYARDRRHVWSGDTLLEGVDAPTLKLLHEHVFKDAHHVYVGTEAVEVPGADAASFVKVAGLGEGKAALFRDRSRHFVYDPTFNEVWSLEQKAGTIVISKPVWLWTKEARRPVRGATVSARLTGEQLSEPEIVLDPAVKASRPPNGEKGKLIDMKSLLIEARKLMGN